MIKLLRSKHGFSALEWKGEDINFHISDVMLEVTGTHELYTTEFTDDLDAKNENVKIGELEYSPSYVLACSDPSAFIQAFFDWKDKKIKELEQEEAE